MTAQISLLGPESKRRAIGSHHSANAKTHTWLTPPHILDALGPFDLDPCACPEPRPWATASTMWTREDAPLDRPWSQLQHVCGDRECQCECHTQLMLRSPQIVESNGPVSSFRVERGFRKGGDGASNAEKQSLQRTPSFLDGTGEDISQVGAGIAIEPGPGSTLRCGVPTQRSGLAFLKKSGATSAQRRESHGSANDLLLTTRSDDSAISDGRSVGPCRIGGSVAPHGLCSAPTATATGSSRRITSSRLVAQISQAQCQETSCPLADDATTPSSTVTPSSGLRTGDASYASCLICAAKGCAARWWNPRVFLNPPFGPKPLVRRFMSRMAEHNRGTALLIARTETELFFDFVWSKAAAVFFLKSRPFFHHQSGKRAKGTSGAPVVLIAYGDFDAFQLAHSGLAGRFLSL